MYPVSRWSLIARIFIGGGIDDPTDRRYSLPIHHHLGAFANTLQLMTATGPTACARTSSSNCKYFRANLTHVLRMNLNSTANVCP